MFSKNWTEIVKPSGLQIDKDSEASDYMRFIAEPLEQGYGITIGHALRRVLLSSIRGSAVYAINIDKVSHEFTGIPGIVEDVTEIILNLSELQINQYQDEEIELELIGEGETVLTAKDIATFGKAEIINKDLEIATLNHDAQLNMTLYVRQNKGYITAEENQNADLPVNTIYLDSNHSPVKRIKYEVQNARVGRETEFDRLVFELWTNNSVDPQSAVAYAAQILKEQMDIFIHFKEKIVQDKAPSKTVKVNDNLSKNVSELELSVRSINCLQNAKIDTIADLVQKTERDMLETKNFGKKSLDEIKAILAEMGLSLGMDLDRYNS